MKKPTSTKRAEKMQVAERKIFIFSEVKNFVFSPKEIFSLIWLLDSSKFSISMGELSIAFLGEKKMRDIHCKFLADESLTDVITFPGDRETDFAGEICTSPDYAFENCKRYGTTFSEELNLYLIHGYLHLFGLNDTSESEKIRMREGENFCMSLAKTEHCLAKFAHKCL
ncbi:MAG: rRNA maturation RNase YbeY [Puniceicoccales bacterium]|jgi:probable rRNA maturation factor|nr:rRNA maturation RNase YbeY [Puniceicoccales bacterium]